MPPGLRLDDTDGVRTLLLDRPERANALDPSLVEALTVALVAAAATDVRLLVLRGLGRHFSAGFDLDDVTDVAALRDRFLAIQDLLDAVRQVPCPTLAVVHGAAVGAGADLAAACDLRVGTAAATFRFPGLGFGLALGLRQLVQRVGPDHAIELVLLGRSFDAATARSAGLLTHLVTDVGEADALVAEVAGTTQALSGPAVRRLLGVTRTAPDPSERQLLVDSLAEPDLAVRLAAHRRSYLRRARS